MDFRRFLLKRTKPVSWIILSYDVPDEPSRIRVRLWRQLKGMGALYPPFSFYIVPDSPDVQSRLGELVSTVKSYGPLTLFKAKALSRKYLETTYSLFEEDFEKEYRELHEECEEFLDEIKNNITTGNITPTEVSELEELLHGLERWYSKIRRKDFISTSGPLVAEKLLNRCHRSLLSFSERAQPKRVGKVSR